MLVLVLVVCSVSVGVVLVLKKKIRRFPAKLMEKKIKKANFFLKGICTLGNVLTYQATFVKTSQKSRYIVLRDRAEMQFRTHD